MISRIVRVSVRVISLSLWVQLITITLTLIILDITHPRRPRGSKLGRGKRLKWVREKFEGKKSRMQRRARLSFAFLTFLPPNFFLTHLDFFLPRLTARGSLRMDITKTSSNNCLNLFPKFQNCVGKRFEG